jgi:hypothetical protein
MSIKVRPELLAVAKRVHDELGHNEDGTIGREQIERAIKVQADAKDTRPFSEAEYSALLRLRSQAFKAPDKKLRLL